MVHFVDIWTRLSDALDSTHPLWDGMGDMQWRADEVEGSHHAPQQSVELR